MCPVMCGGDPRWPPLAGRAAKLKIIILGGRVKLCHVRYASENIVGDACFSRCLLLKSCTCGMQFWHTYHRDQREIGAHVHVCLCSSYRIVYNSIIDDRFCCPSTNFIFYRVTCMMLNGSRCQLFFAQNSNDRRSTTYIVVMTDRNVTHLCSKFFRYCCYLSLTAYCKCVYKYIQYHMVIGFD